MNDYAGVLSAPERERLETKLAERERATGAQMVIAIFPSLGGESLEDVSIRLAEKWKVGRKGVDNGVVLVVFLKERKMRIEVGYGLEGAITDIVAAGIIRDAIAPRFREQRYAAGLEAAVDAVFARIGGGGTTRRGGPAPGSAADSNTVLLIVLLFGGVFAVAIFAAVRAMQRLRHGYTVDGRGWNAHPPIIWGGGGSSWSGGGGGGGFSGGGGDFGGGGSSGDW